jgi:hypothetical protein
VERSLNRKDNHTDMPHVENGLKESVLCQIEHYFTVVPVMARWK